MKVLVCGGRDYDDKDTVNTVLLQAYKDYCFTTVVQGGARGADRLAKEWATTNGLPVEEYKADWARYGKGAGLMRNKEMLDKSGAELVIAFPGGNGTFHMVQTAQRKPGVHVITIYDSRWLNDDKED